MKQKIFHIVFIISIIGIFFLLIIPEFASLKTTDIQDLNENLLNKKVKISGEIMIIRNKETFKILTIQDNTGKIDITCNCGDIENYQNVIVTGTLQKYQEKLQIQVDKITQT